MTWIHFCTANQSPQGRSSQADSTAAMMAGLTDLGHNVTSSDDRVEQRAINVFFGDFLPGMAQKVKETGITYGVIATEIPDGQNGFNMLRDDFWQARYAGFLEIASEASFIWSFVREGHDFYGQFGPTSYVEMGFSERMIPDDLDQEPDLDFSFFGAVTPYREAIVNRLRRHARVEWRRDFPPMKEIGKIVSRTKVGLCCKYSEQWLIPSSTRLLRLLHAKRAIAADFVQNTTRQSEIAGCCGRSDDFVGYALDILHSDWRKRANDAYERYRREMPMSTIMEQVLDHTFVGVF